MEKMDGNIKETVLLILYIINKEELSVNTLNRYLYLYYISENFLFSDNTKVNVFYKNYNISISGVRESLNQIHLSGLIKLSSNKILITNDLSMFVKKFLENKDGYFYFQYRKLLPFVSLLNSYDDEFIFTIFFSEPELRKTEQSNKETVTIRANELEKLLTKFKKQIKVEEIEEIDILGHWMNFVIAQKVAVKNEEY